MLKRICYFDNYIFTRVATVDMVLWEDTRTLMITSYGQYSEHEVATGTIEFATRAGKIARTADKWYMQQKGIVSSQRSLSCELQYNYLCSK